MSGIFYAIGGSNYAYKESLEIDLDILKESKKASPNVLYIGAALDDDLKQEYVLNNYYEALFGSYSDGIIRFPLSNLPIGNHKLFFRVWDLQNNSSSTELEFEVVKDLKSKLNNVYVYPNPVVDVANIVIEHDRPLNPFDAQLYVYDLSGHLISQENLNVVTDISNKITIEWNLKPSITEGLYFIKVVFIDNNGKKSTKSTKIFVRKQ